jgi:hypothetical protein
MPTPGDDDVVEPGAPALNIEEWIQYGADLHVMRDLAAGRRPWGFQRRLTPVQKLHAVAAMALYGQPFGFTHDDLRLLRTDPQAHAPAGWIGISDRAHRLENLAQRIAALLPPEGVEPTQPEG